ncbi:hypothetical protein GCM10023175_45130 [Pseudonocardia xishanensis]|uniref:Uncharacterized protein n=1 Tax=Pseudonocardia xishanensis TaxID=630995 RepID=A0ABP8RXX4_9PSEU
MRVAAVLAQQVAGVHQRGERVGGPGLRTQVRREHPEGRHRELQRRAAGLVAPDDLPLLEEAVEVGDGLPLEQAESLLALGTALRRCGRRVEARAPLRRGLDLALGCGAGAVAGRARAELVAAGARPRRLRTSGADALSAGAGTGR